MQFRVDIEPEGLPVCWHFMNLWQGYNPCPEVLAQSELVSIENSYERFPFPPVFTEHLP